MSLKSQNGSIEFQMLVKDKQLNLEDVDYLMHGFALGKWSTRRVMRLLKLNRVEFIYAAMYYEVSQPSYPHYMSVDEINAIEKSNRKKIDMTFGQPEGESVSESSTESERTIVHVSQLWRTPKRRTLLIPSSSKELIALQKRGRLDVLTAPNWETHISKTCLFAASNVVEEQALESFKRHLQSCQIHEDDLFSFFTSKSMKGLSIKDYTDVLDTCDFTANYHLAIDLQDDAEREVDTIVLSTPSVEKLKPKNITKDSRNFVMDVGSFIQMVDREKNK